MKISKKIDLIRNIAEDLNSRYDLSEIEIFLDAFKIKLEIAPNTTLLQDIKVALRNMDNIELIELAEELGIGISEHIKIKPPKNWENSNNIKAFISHLSIDKDLAKRLRDELKIFSIDAFVAHEDIKPSEEWQIEINKALQTMDFFISIHTIGFSESYWCQQEVGYAVARNAKIIPIKFDKNQDPVGFIGKIQALIRGKKKAQIVAKEIVDILKNDDKTKYLFEDLEKIDELTEEEIPF